MRLMIMWSLSVLKIDHGVSWEYESVEMKGEPVAISESCVVQHVGLVISLAYGEGYQGPSPGGRGRGRNQKKSGFACAPDDAIFLRCLLVSITGRARAVAANK